MWGLYKKHLCNRLQMDRMKTLLGKSLTQFILYATIILILVTPLFYYLTKYFYAEDLIEAIDVLQRGRQQMPDIDLERDIVVGSILQIVLIVIVLSIAFIFTMRYVSHKTWEPFNHTLEQLEHFTLEEGNIPNFKHTNIKEFEQLNKELAKLIGRNIKTYSQQKEFIENASHELQTPLAVMQGKLDLLLQQPELTDKQADIIKNMYELLARMTRLNRNLLLLARIENKQYIEVTDVNIKTIVENILMQLDPFMNGKQISLKCTTGAKPKASQILVESLVSNLITNALRHTPCDGTIDITITDSSLTVANPGEEYELDKEKLFQRFYRSDGKANGNGLGLAIVKAICDFHGWRVNYYYQNSKHYFSVSF